MSSSKVFSSAAEAVADISDGAIVMIGGYAVPGTPQGLVSALISKGARDLTCISGPWYGGEPGLSDVSSLVAGGQVKRIITATPIDQDCFVPALDRRSQGTLEVEIVSQGTLAERIRAAGAGLGAVLLPAGEGAAIDPAKGTRVINGVVCTLETPLMADFALIRAHKADSLGNLVYRRAQRNWNPTMATAARVTIAEVDEILEPGDLDPELVITPGIYVNRIVEV